LLSQFLDEIFMTSFNPPISEKNTEELIQIANASKEQWQQEAINQAKKELVNRGVTQAEQDRIIKKWLGEADDNIKKEIERLDENKTESYEIWEIVVLFIFGPILFLEPHLFNSHSLFTLRSEKYYLKFRQRIIIFVLSFVVWGFYINYNYRLAEKKRIEEAEKINIDDWKKKYGY